jgi:hypothetical protein
MDAILDHPVRSAEEASRHFLYVAATPPRGGGEYPLHNLFVLLPTTSLMAFDRAVLLGSPP